ncbi:hypothetical protein ACTJJB_12880 [Chitinophaga sp. 22536]|uniref:hypothetical protein n=1 Tax=unclassified Chitinophaga TaxID=2619133 RepID=UPI003F864753
MQIAEKARYTEKGTVSFKKFVLGDTFNKNAIWVCFLIMCVEFGVFKYFYPQAGFINADSYSYIQSAFNNLSIDTYPIGYAKFLRFFSIFSTSDTCLVAIQYLMIQFSMIWMLYSFFYFFDLRKWIRGLLLVALVLGPVSLFLSNYVSSDALFFALSINWFTILIWILQKPSVPLLIWHSVVIVMAFMVRYNALFYPIISGLAFLINRSFLKEKIVGILISFILIGSFVLFTGGQYKNLTGSFQFSPFTGWQMANNAMYAYRFIDSMHREEVPDRFKELDQDVRNYFDSTKNYFKYPQELLLANTFYMWRKESPLRVYMNRLYRKDSSAVEFKKWASVGGLYNEYGKMLIKRYPAAFARYYLWPNFLKFYAPPVEFLQIYNSGLDTVQTTGRNWFKYSSNKLKYRTKTRVVEILDWYPVFNGVLNALFVMMSFSFFALGGRYSMNNLFHVWCLYFSFWTVNLLFSVFASPVALRFQLFPFSLCMLFNMVMLDFVIKAGLNMKSIDSLEIAG